VAHTIVAVFVPGVAVTAVITGAVVSFRVKVPVPVAGHTALLLAASADVTR